MSDCPECLEVNEGYPTAHLPVTPEKYAEFQQATADDPGMQALSSLVRNGCLKSKEGVPSTVHRGYRDELSAVDGLLFRAQRLIVPHSLRKEMLDRIH